MTTTSETVKDTSLTFHQADWIWSQPQPPLGRSR